MPACWEWRCSAAAQQPGPAATVVGTVTAPRRDPAGRSLGAAARHPLRQRQRRDGPLRAARGSPGQLRPGRDVRGR
ncbi:MAG: hypothetical protein WKG07_03795 [Hymenobacter sp.]